MTEKRNYTAKEATLENPTFIDRSNFAPCADERHGEVDGNSKESCGQRPLEAVESMAREARPPLAPIPRPAFLPGSRGDPTPPTGGGAWFPTQGQGDSRESFPSVLVGPSGFTAQRGWRCRKQRSNSDGRLPMPIRRAS